MVRKTLRWEFNFFKDMETKIQGCNIPFFNLSKEVTKLMKDALEEAEAGRIMFALYDYLYEGIEPEFDTKIMRSVWNNVISVVERKAKTYFQQVERNRENGKKGGRPKQESMNEDKTKLFKVAAVKENVNENTGDFRPEIPQDDTRVQQDIESVLKGQEMGKNEVFNIPSDITEKIKAVTSNSSLVINEKYKGIAGILKPYLRNVPSRKHSEIVDFFYKQFNEAA